MGFMDEYYKALQSDNAKNSSSGSGGGKSSSSSFMDEYNKAVGNTNKTSTKTNVFTKDIAPISGSVFTRKTVSRKKKEEEEKKKRKWFEKGLFEDGWDFGDITKTILGIDEDTASLKDLTINSAKRGYYNSLYGEETFKEMGGQKNQKDVYEQILAGDEYQFTPGNDAAGAISGAAELLGQQFRQFTNPRTLALAGTAAGAAAIAGQAGPQVLVPEEIISVPAAAMAAFTTGSSMSNLEIEAGHAYNEMLDAGISEETARKVAMGVGAVNAGLELLQVDELLDAYKVTKASGATKTFTKKILDELLERGVDVGKETLQEVAQERVTIAGVQFASEMEKGEKAYSADEITDRLLDTAKSSALSFGAMNVPAAAKNTASIVSKQQKANSLTQNEQAVVDKVAADRIAEKEKDGTKLTNKEKAAIEEQVVKDMERGYISTDTIEEVLGGESYRSYKETVDREDAILKEYDELGEKPNATPKDYARYTELTQQVKDIHSNSQREALRAKLDEDVMGIVQGSRLAESYNERTRRSQKFEADVTKYDTKQQAVIQKAIDSGILNNTNRTHEFVDIIAKISADKGVLFDFTNNKKLKESGFAIDGRQVNGFVTKDGISLNIDSPQAWQKTVGHEVTHVLEGTEFYTELQKTLFDYAESKGELGSRFDTLKELYKDVQDADINAELTADLVGEYLFTDESFIKNLSTEHRNVFQKIYDEIKYLCKIATGSKEAKELEKVKRAFDKAYKEAGKAQNGTKYSVSDKNIKDISTGYSHGESYYTMSYMQDGKVVATLEYGEYDGEANVKMIEVDPEYRRKGIATKLLQELQNKYEGTEIDFGMSTPDGTKLLESITYDVTDEAVVADRQKFKDLQAELNDLQEKLDVLYDTENLTEEQDAELHRLGDRWQEVYESIHELSENLRGKKATRTFVKTDVKYSLSDSDGKQLTKEQQEYFKDSKMRDENGNLKVMYHGSQDAGFHVFDSSMSDDGTSFFFVDRNDVAASYSGTTETYAPRVWKSAEDANNFLKEIGFYGGYYGYEVVENNGKYSLITGGEEIATSENPAEIYEEFCDYEGVGYGDANYKVYLNLKNPLEVDAEGREWDDVSDEFWPELYEQWKTSFTQEEKYFLADLAREGFGTFRNEIELSVKDAGKPTADKYTKALNSAYWKNSDMSSLFRMAADNFSDELLRAEAVKQMTTRDFAQKAKAEGYDGVIFKNIVDVGAYGGDYNPATVAIAFDSNQIKSVANAKPTADPDIRYSLSKEGEQFGKTGQFATPATELRYEAPVAEESSVSAPVAENATTTPTVAHVKESLTTDVDEVPVTVADMQEIFPNNAVPVQAELEQLVTERDQLYKALEIAVDRGSAAEVGKLAEEYEALNSRIKALESTERERTGSITDADAPAEMEAPYHPTDDDYEGIPETVDDPFEERDWYKVGNQKVKAYMYENPEVKPFFQAEAQNLLGELSDTQKGERWYNDDVYYASGGEKGFGGQKRLTSDSIATLLDDWGMSYADIEKGLNAIIEDNGAENIAAAKKIEFMLNDRLLNGYKDFYTKRRIEPNQDYINLLNEKQINSYSNDAFDSFMANADQYAPTQEEYYAPMLNSDPRYEQTAPVYDLPGGQQTYTPTKATYDAAPMFDATGKKGVPDGQQAFMPDAGVEKKQTRKEYHQSIIDNIKTTFKAKGFDFDKVLKGAKNLSTWSTVDNTPQRVMEKSLGYKEGGILADITVNKVAQNESEGIKWLNAYVAQLKQISKQYGIKPGSKESAAAQMYAEGFYVNENNEIVRYGYPELVQDFGDADVRRRIIGLARDGRIRKIYDDTLANINESRARNLYPEIPRLDNYFLHFRAMNDTFSTLGLPFNPNDIRAKDLPTDLNGVTADLKPGQPYFASANHRTGKRTSFDLLGGVERYLNSAKNQIYHIDDIQTLRALRNYIAETYGQATGLEDIDSMTDAEAEERIKQVYGSHLSTFAKFLNEEANVLAGKTALIDRGLEGIIGRRGMTFLNTLKSQVGSNMVGGNVSSSLTNFMPVAQTFAKANKFDFTKAFVQTVANKLSGGRFDTFTEDSPVVIRRKGSDRFAKTMWQKLSEPGYVLMSAVDDISTEIVARTKYNEFIRKGMDSQKAHFETDKWVSKLMGDRSLGQQPHLYNSKLFGILTQFQLEVRNQLDMEFYDTYQEAKVSSEYIENALARNAKTAAKTASTILQLTVAQHFYGKAFEAIAGYNPAFDIVEVLATLFGYDDEEDSEDTALDNLSQALLALAEDMPYASTFTGGRIPISAAIPDVNAVLRGEDKYGNEIGVLNAMWDETKEIAPYYLIPTGYGQAKKTYQGLKMFSDDHPIAGSYTEAGNLRFPVEDTVGNRIKAGVFGQYASENAQKYFDQEQRTLNPEQTEIFAGLDIPIEEYWDYRDDLYEFYDVKDQVLDAAYADDATDEDILKGAYIDAVNDELYDLYDQQKELASGNSKNKKSEMRELQEQMQQLLNESKYALGSINHSGAYAEIGSKRFNYSADKDRWYEIRPKDDDGSDNLFYVREQLSRYKLGMSYEDYWNGKKPTAANQNHYGEYNGRRFNYDVEDNFWYEITPKNSKGEDNWYYQQEQIAANEYGVSYEDFWNNRETYIKALNVADNDGEPIHEIVKSVYGIEKFASFAGDLTDIHADIDAKGNYISGSKKQKVKAYIDSLDLDYGEKIILYRTQYSAKADKRKYNQDIFDYLNERDDIDYQEMKSILEELDFKVDDEGYVDW